MKDTYLANLHLRTANRIANGIDFTIGGLELLVDLDAVRRVGDASAVEGERLQVRLAPRCHQEVRAFDDDALTILMEMHSHALH